MKIGHVSMSLKSNILLSKDQQYRSNGSGRASLFGVRRRSSNDAESRFRVEGFNIERQSFSNSSMLRHIQTQQNERPRNAIVLDDQKANSFSQTPKFEENHNIISSSKEQQQPDFAIQPQLKLRKLIASTHALAQDSVQAPPTTVNQSEVLQVVQESNRTIGTGRTSEEAIPTIAVSRRYHNLSHNDQEENLVIVEHSYSSSIKNLRNMKHVSSTSQGGLVKSSIPSERNAPVHNNFNSGVDTLDFRGNSIQQHSHTTHQVIQNTIPHQQQPIPLFQQQFQMATQPITKPVPKVILVREGDWTYEISGRDLAYYKRLRDQQKYEMERERWISKLTGVAKQVYIDKSPIGRLNTSIRPQTTGNILRKIDQHFKEKEDKKQVLVQFFERLKAQGKARVIRDTDNIALQPTTVIYSKDVILDQSTENQALLKKLDEEEQQDLKSYSIPNQVILVNQIYNDQSQNISYYIPGTQSDNLQFELTACPAEISTLTQGNLHPQSLISTCNMNPVQNNNNCGNNMMVVQGYKCSPKHPTTVVLNQINAQQEEVSKTDNIIDTSTFVNQGVISRMGNQQQQLVSIHQSSEDFMMMLGNPLIPQGENYNSATKNRTQQYAMPRPEHHSPHSRFAQTTYKSASNRKQHHQLDQYHENKDDTRNLIINYKSCSSRERTPDAMILPNDSQQIAVNKSYRFSSQQRGFDSTYRRNQLFKSEERENSNALRSSLPLTTNYQGLVAAAIHGRYQGANHKGVIQSRRRFVNINQQRSDQNSNDEGVNKHMRQQNILMSSYIESSKAPQMQPLLQHPLNEDLQGINAGTVLTTGNEITERAGMHIHTEELEQLGTGKRQQAHLEVVNDRVRKVELRQIPPNINEYQNQNVSLYNDGRAIMDPNDPRIPGFMASTQTQNQMMSTGGMDLNLAFSSYNGQTQQSLQQKKFHLLSPKMYEKYLQGKISILPVQEFKMPLDASEVSPKLDYHDNWHQRISPRPNTSHQQKGEKSPSKQKFSNQQIIKRLQSGSALTNDKGKPQLIGGGFNKGRYSGATSQSRIENSLEDDYEENINIQGQCSITSTISAQREKLKSQGHSMNKPNLNWMERGKKPSTAKQGRGVQTIGNRKLYDTPHFGNDKDTLEMHTRFHQQKQQQIYEEAVCSPNYEEVQRMSIQSKEVYQQADITSLVTSPPDEQHNQSNLNSTAQDLLNTSENVLLPPQSANKKNVLISKKSFHNPPGSSTPPDIAEAFQQTSIPQVQLVTNSDVNGTQSSIQQNENSPAVCEPNQNDLNAQQEALLEHIIEETCESLDSGGGLGGGSHHTMKSNFNQNYNNPSESPAKVNQEIKGEKVIKKKKRIISRQNKGSITHQPVTQSQLQEGGQIINEKNTEELQVEERPLTERRILISNAALHNELRIDKQILPNLVTLQQDQNHQLDQPYAITNQNVNVRIKKNASKNSLENAAKSARSHSSQNRQNLFDQGLMEQDKVKLRGQQQSISDQKSPHLNLRVANQLENLETNPSQKLQKGKDIPTLSQKQIQAIQKEGIILGLGLGQGRIHRERDQSATVHTKHTLQVMSSRGDFDAQPKYDSDSQLSQRHKLGKSDSHSKELVARVPSQNGFNQVGVKEQLSQASIQNKRPSISQLSNAKGLDQTNGHTVNVILQPNKQNSSIKTPQASIIQGVTPTQQNFFNSNSQVVVKHNGQTLTQTRWIHQGSEAPFPQGADFLGVRISQKDQGMSTDDRGHHSRIGRKRSLQQFAINAVVEFVSDAPKDILSNDAERKENLAMNHQKFIVPSSTFKIDAKKEQMLKRNIHFHRKANMRIREIQSQAVSKRKSLIPNNAQDRSSSQCGARKSSQIQDSYLNQSMGNPSQSMMIDPDYYFQHMNSGDNTNNIQGIEQFCNSWLATPTPPHLQMTGAQINQKRTQIPIIQKFQTDHQQNVIEGGFGELAKVNVSTGYNQQPQPSNAAIGMIGDTQNQQKQEDNSTIKDESIYYPQSSIHQHLTKPMITGGLISEITCSPSASPKGQKQTVHPKQHPNAIVNIATSNLQIRQSRLPASTVPVSPKIIANNAQDIIPKNVDISSAAITPDLIGYNQQNRILSQSYTDASTPNAVKKAHDHKYRIAKAFHEISESQVSNQQAFKKVEVNQFLPLMQNNLNVPIIHQKGQSSNISQDSEQVSYSSHQLQMQSNHRKLKSSMGITNFYNPLPANRSIYTAPSSAGLRQRPTQANSSDLKRNSDNHTRKSSSNQEAFIFKSDHQMKPNVAFGSSNHLLINRKSADHSSKMFMPAINQSSRLIIPPMTAGAHNSPRQLFKLQGNHINIQRSRPATTTNALGIPGYSALQMHR